jgi:hypothetical protein
VEISIETSQKPKNRTIKCSYHTTLGYTPEGKQFIMLQKDLHAHLVTALLIIDGVLFSHQEEQNYVNCRKMEETGDHHVMQSKSNSDKYYIISVIDAM